MENKTVQSCTKTVHFRWLVSVFSGVLPLIQSYAPTNSPYGHRAHSVSYVHAHSYPYTVTIITNELRMIMSLKPINTYDLFFL